MLLVVAASLVPGTLLALRDASQAIKDARFYPSPEGRRFLVAQRQILRLAENPRFRLLTDSGFLQLYQKSGPVCRPVPVPPHGRFRAIRPHVILKELRSESYDQLIMTYDLNDPGYDANTCGLPRWACVRL